MKISLNWLSDYLNTDLTPEETVEKLTLLGLEVEEVETVGNNLEKVLVGQILEVKPHPDADRLTLCMVDLGRKTVQIVCGAPNVEQGQRVAVADVGATVIAPGGSGGSLEIRKTKLRGETSEGMICSESELGLGESHDGIMVLDSNADPGRPLAEAMGIDPDTIIEIALTPNRPDAASHIGVARDLGASLGKEICTPYSDDDEIHSEGELTDLIDISIKQTDRCHRYVARMVRGLKIAPSPDWLQQRLRNIGLRPVNNVVDCTNYILHEVGQPLHAFDYKKLGKSRIRVDIAEEEQTFVTLDGVERTVPAETLFICDGDGPVALAGIMGGVESEVDEQTDTILIESAWFEPSGIRKSSKMLALQTDSSYRFERGVDPNLTAKACERAAKMIADICDGEIVDGEIDCHPVKSEPADVTLRIERLNSLLGTALQAEEAARILNALEIKTTVESGGILTCRVPTFRPDITREVDLIEEVGRIHDYNRIPPPESTPFVQPAPLDATERLDNKVRTIATRLSYKEISTNSLLSEREESFFSEEAERIRTLNPVSQEATTLRTGLLSGFLKSLQFNLNRNARQLRFFEVGHTYRRTEQGGTWIKGIEEQKKLILGLCGAKKNQDWREEQEQLYTPFDLKADLESFFFQMGLDPARDLQMVPVSDKQLEYRYKDALLATLEEISSHITKAFDIQWPVCTAEINLSLLLNSELTDRVLRYKPVPRFPSIEYDVAYIVDRSVTAGELTGVIRRETGNILHRLDVFDVYEGKSLGTNKKSIAIRLTFLDSNKTLTVKDVEPLVNNVTQALETEFGAKLRS